MSSFYFYCWIIHITGLNFADSVDLCMGEESRLFCRQNEIIVMTSSEYGRMEVGRCIPKENDFMGCTNDVLTLLDRKCSGRQECNIKVPNPDLEEENTECLEVLRLYLHATYTCLKGTVTVMQLDSFHSLASSFSL